MNVVYTLTKEQVENLKTIQSRISAYVYLSRDIVDEDNVICEIFNKIDELCNDMENILKEE